jgi:VanZ family protein
VHEQAADAVAMGVLVGGAAAARASAAWSVRAPWLVWTLTIVAVTVPWTDLHAHTHWENVVSTVPLTRHAVADVIANVLLYMPFGYCGTRRGVRPAAVCGLAGALSTVVEALQLTSHSRTPSVIDVAANALGAAAGVLVAVTRGA